MWWALSSVEVLRDWAQGDRAPRRHTGTVSARVAAPRRQAHGHRVGAGAARQATGVQNPPLELSATAPVQANHLEAGGVVLSSVEVLRDRAPRRHTGTVSARVEPNPDNTQQRARGALANPGAHAADPCAARSVGACAASDP